MTSTIRGFSSISIYGKDEPDSSSSPKQVNDENINLQVRLQASLHINPDKTECLIYDHRRLSNDSAARLRLEKAGICPFCLGPKYMAIEEAKHFNGHENIRPA